MADRGDRAHEQWGTYLTSFCQMSKNQTPRLWRRFTKKIINWHNEVHTYWRQFWCHIWWSLKTLKMSIESILGNFVDLHIWHQNWHQYLWTSLRQFIFFMNLLHSLHIWLFDIWHLFDNLTSFSHFDTSIKLKPPQPAQGYFFKDPTYLFSYLL